MTRRLVPLLLAAAAGCTGQDSINEPTAGPAIATAPAAAAPQVAAVKLTGTEAIFGANALGGLVGRIGVPGAFYSNAGAAPYQFGTPGGARDLSEDGNTVVGFTGTCCDGGFVWVNDGSTWQYTVLPRDPSADSHGTWGVGSDGTGAAVYIGGFDFYRTSGTNFVRRPAVWTGSGSSWTRNALPTPAGSDGLVYDVNGTGTAVGMVNNVATVWTESSPGSWDSTAIAGAGSRAWAISPDGQTAVGFAGSAAQYWTLSGDVWTAHSLPGGCTEAVDIDDTGRILANGCANGKAKSPAVISVPYESTNVQLLGGVGTSGTVATAHRMAANGSWIAGEAPSKGATIGVYWRLP